MAGISLVQQGGQAGGDNGGAGTLPFPNPTVAGNTLFAVGFWYNNNGFATTISSITDDAGNIWQFSTATSNQNPPVVSTTNFVSFVAWCFNAASATHVTLTPASSNVGSIWWRVTIGELSGAVGIDAAGAATGTSTTASVSLDLSQPGDFVVGAFDDSSASISTNPSGWTVFTSSGYGNGYATPGAGTYNIAYSLSTSDTWAVAAAAFKPTPPTAGLLMAGII